MLHEQLKYLMYVDCSSRSDLNKGKLIYELNFNKGVRLKRKITSKFFDGIRYKKIEFIIHPKYFDANNIFSHPFIQNIKYKPNMVQDLSRQIKVSLKIKYWRTVSNIKCTK